MTEKTSRISRTFTRRRYKFLVRSPQSERSSSGLVLYETDLFIIIHRHLEEAGTNYFPFNRLFEEDSHLCIILIFLQIKQQDSFVVAVLNDGANTRNKMVRRREGDD